MKYQNRILIYQFFVAWIILTLISSCEKVVPPQLAPTFITGVGQYDVLCGGQIISNGHAPITECGICWSTNPTPTTADHRDSPTSPLYSWTSKITGLTINTTYYMRAYAINKAGIGYGATVAVTTINAQAPYVTTSITSNITETTATSGGNITSDGGATVTERGVCWSTSANPTIADNKIIDGAGGSGSFTNAITGLLSNTTYYLRAYATNSIGIRYGNSVTFSTNFSSTFAVGAIYQGGKIAYVFQPNDLGYIPGETHGLIAAPSDQGVLVPWGCKDTAITGADFTDLGKGNENTNDIINGCPTEYAAARLCSNLVLGTFSDWYLPSQDELNKLYLNSSQIGGFHLSEYWTSTENYSQQAYYQSFADGRQSTFNKDYLRRVRAIRYF